MDLNREALVVLCRRWEAEARRLDGRMRDMLGCMYYSSLSEEERKRYCLWQAEYTALRGCANDLADLLGVKRER